MKITIQSGQEVLIDDADYSLLNNYGPSHVAGYSKNKGGALRSVYAPGKAYPDHIFMHTEIMKPPPGSCVIHKNGNLFDNRRDNLEVITNSELKTREGPRKNNTSGYKGVSWNNQARKWQVSIMDNGKRVMIGMFSNKEEAAQEYNDAALFYYGPSAFQNTIVSKKFTGV
jgi:hypothetical protein